MARTPQPWRDEMGRNASPKWATQRGIDILNAYPHRGWIQFLGGPLHSQFRCLAEWPSVFHVHEHRPDPIMWHDPADPFEKIKVREVVYGLAKCYTGRGSLSYAYVATDDQRSPELPGIPDDVCDRICEVFATMATRAFQGMIGHGTRVRPPWAVAFELEFGRLCAIESKVQD